MHVLDDHNVRVHVESQSRHRHFANLHVVKLDAPEVVAQGQLLSGLVVFDCSYLGVPCHLEGLDQLVTFRNDLVYVDIRIAADDDQ